MAKRFLFMFLIFASQNLKAQSTVNLYTWVRNLTGATGYNSIPSNVQSIYYTTTDVYVSATCIPGYSIGPWAGNPNTPVNQNYVYKITRNPAQNTGTATNIGLGHTGVWTNGVSVYNVSDGMSYNNAGVWNRNAYFWEGGSFDNCLGHPAPNGEYHHHVNPSCLYDKTDNTRHSPIIGYAFDGFPIYGAYGYTNTNGTGPIKRMVSSYAITNPSATTRTNGPAVNATYPLGCFMEDYSFSVANGGDLDFRNGRFCITPEYPTGTYAYFVTLDASLNPAFPYTMYKSYYGIVQAGNTGPTGSHNTIPGTAVQYTSLRVPTVSIAASANPICSGNSVSFTPTVTQGGTVTSYQWKKNNVNIATGSTYTTNSLANGDVISCVLTSNEYYLTSTTATSNSVTMTVSPAVTPSVTISTVTSTICSGTSLTFTASPVNGGSSPLYQWKKNGINVGTGLSSYLESAPANNDVVTCQMVSNAACAAPAAVSANSITLNVAACSVTLNLKLLIEGFYAGNGLMTGILSSSVTDSVKVQLVSTNAQHSILYSKSNIISTTGIGSFEFPSASLGGNYYIVVKHRNAMETWSAQPVGFASTSVSYDFTNSLTKAYGNNLCNLNDGYFALWSGDISDASNGLGFQDGVIESQDYSDLENALSVTLLGYNPQDLTGDGVVESSDYSLMEGNVYYTKAVSHP